MKTYNFQEQITNIRKEALKIGYTEVTMNGYLKIWENYIKWKDKDDFIYNDEEYSKFLLEYYGFDVTQYTSKSKSFFQQLMRSKRILDDFDTYKQRMTRRTVVNNKKDELYTAFSKEIDKYCNYCKNIKYNADSSISTNKNYLTNLFVYFQNKGLNHITDINKEIIESFIKETIDKGNRSKSRYFYILRCFLLYLYDENILNTNYGYIVPTVKRQKNNKRIPTYLKVEEINKILDSFPRNKAIDKRDYAIILTAVELGMRIGDILNLTLDDIDWQNKKITFIQEKTKNRNILPLSIELGNAYIDYLTTGRPKTKSRYIFIKHTQPYDKMISFEKFSKYFEKAGISHEYNNSKGIHNLRHSLAKRMLDNEIPLPIISKTLGHSSMDTTQKFYLKIDKERLKQCSLEVL